MVEPEYNQASTWLSPATFLLSSVSCICQLATVKKGRGKMKTKRIEERDDKMKRGGKVKHRKGHYRERIKEG